jgi:hypothetical protein
MTSKRLFPEIGSGNHLHGFESVSKFLDCGVTPQEDDWQLFLGKVFAGLGRRTELRP